MTRLLTIVLTTLLMGAAAGADPTPPLLEQAQALEVSNIREPKPGILTGGQITREQLQALAVAGVSRFVSLRPAAEVPDLWEEELAAELGIKFVRLPIAGADDLTEEAARTLATELDGEGAALLYCASGQRAGALLALAAFHVEGVSAEEAWEIGKAAGVTRLEPRLRELLGLHP